MKVGDYVRTKTGIIGKIKLIDNQTELEDLYLIKRKWYYKEDIIKSSPNIIDLIEVGDYVNGFKVYSVYDDDDEVNEYNLKHKKCLGKNIYDEDYQEHLIYEENIKSIVTKEQFESMEYRIGE